MIRYLDTSSLVKLSIEEDGSDQVELDVDRSDQVVTSRVHLASVIGIRDRISDSVLLSTWDVQLGEAALAEGFQVAHQPPA